jgi:superfamily II DNA/RNA helicase
MHFVDDLSHKNRLLDHLLRDATIDQAVVFTATKRDADTVSDRLNVAGLNAAALHGDMHQGARNRTLTAMRRGQVRILVATDVAARGIDVPTITHVFNYDLPKFAEDYVHRIGRTGRAGRNGLAISLVITPSTSTSGRSSASPSSRFRSKSSKATSRRVGRRRQNRDRPASRAGRVATTVRASLLLPAATACRVRLTAKGPRAAMLRVPAVAPPPGLRRSLID